MNTIPSVNLKDFLSENLSIKEKFINEIGHAYETIGFVALKGHFLKEDLIDNLYGEIKNFFDLPIETKEKYEIPGIGGQRGYISFGKEAEKTAKYVLRALALHLKLDEFYFDDFIKEGNSILRPIHYPPIKTEPKGAERAAAHGDINLITLLMGAQGKGLQVQNHNGDWIDAVAEPDELMINVGDMLSRHSNNKLKSTIHRVTNPPKELWGTSRYSIPFFMHPVSDMKLNVLDNCIDKDNPKKFEDITAGEFLDERLRELGLKK